MGISLTGCGNAIPDMTAEQMSAVSEYAVELLLKYDTHHRSRLVDLSLYPEEPVYVPEPTEEPQTGMDEVADTPVVSLGGGNQQEELRDRYTLEDVVSLPENILIQYNGYQLVNSYPGEDNPDSYLSINASEGNRLLILSFFIYNDTAETRKVDVFGENLRFMVNVNGSGKKNCMLTMFDNDLSVYMGELVAGGYAEVVLLTEIETSVALDVQTIELNTQNGGEIKTVLLQ